MDSRFICKKCGNVQNIDEGTACKKCHMLMDWRNYFPTLNVLECLNSARILYDLTKKSDQEHLKDQHEFLNSVGKFDIDNTTLDKFNNQYEKYLIKDGDTSESVLVDACDKFEEFLCQSMPADKALTICTAIITCGKNYLRKPYVIMGASIIEQLFNHYFEILIREILPERGQQVFLDKYETTGIQSALSIIDSFSDEKLCERMERYSKGFYNKWTELRRLRNRIIHSNNCYISKIRTTQINSLVEESLKVFLELESEFYKNKYNKEIHNGTI